MICITCKQDKEQSEFYERSGERAGTYFTHCKTCDGQRRTKNRVSNRDTLELVYPKTKCSRCGYSEFKVALDYHHINPDIKQFNISKNYGLDIHTLLMEASKCVVLCANCHRAKDSNLW